jgi:hypothetical protein
MDGWMDGWREGGREGVEQDVDADVTVRCEYDASCILCNVYNSLPLNFRQNAAYATEFR